MSIRGCDFVRMAELTVVADKAYPAPARISAMHGVGILSFTQALALTGVSAGLG
ncbi:MAG: hypothetical protein ACRDVE_18245 [Actinocrinis sp.]